MNAERWREIDELLDLALNLPESEREVFLAEKCAGDDDLRREVLSLLKAEEEARGFMEKSAMNALGKALADDLPTVADQRFLGATIGNYKIERLLGMGGMGEVYLARDGKLNRLAALKILPREFVADLERRKRFEREARLVSSLNHPNIVTIYDVGSDGDVNYIATEYIEGKTLREFVGEPPRLKDVLSIMLQTAEALDAAHERGIIHRDIKPENIMIRPDGYVKVLDFGLAKLAEPLDCDEDETALGKTQKGVVMGTPAYMSPEQVSCEELDRRTDIWSLGVVLYELLAGEKPFKADSKQATFHSILSHEPRSVSGGNASFPAALDAILEKALEKDRELRYQTASDFRADVKRLKRDIDSSPSLSGRAVGIPKNERAAGRRKKSLLFAAGAFLSVLAGLGYWLAAPPAVAEKPEAIEWSQAQHQQLTVLPGIEGYPSLSPDGKSFVYATDTEGVRNIYAQRVGGRNPQNLTPNSRENNTMPAFSPDGKFIAFRSERRPAGIYVMEETGENVRRVADIGFHPSWSPDGRQLVVSDRAAAVHTAHTVPNSSLWIIDVETGNKRLLETKGDAIQPNWSPNGKRIAYWFISEGQLGEIATVPSEGGEPVVVASDASTDWNPVWSPDGKFLYFASDRLGSMSFWRVAIDERTGKATGEPEAVPTTSKYPRQLNFSRDGKRLIYVRYESQSNLQSIAFDPKINKIAGEVRWVTRGDREISFPDMSPDGEHYVIRIPSRTDENLGIIDKDGSNWRFLMDDKFRERLPRFSPDGKKIAFHSDRSGKYQIWTINADGSDARQITFTEKTGAIAPGFSPDGTRMFFTQIDDKLQMPFVLDLTKSWDEQTAQPLPPFPGFQGSFSARDWSPDGSKLLILFYEPDGDESGVGVYDFAARGYEKLTDSGSNPVWLNDNRHFLYNDRKSIYLFDTQTKKSTLVLRSPPFDIQHPNISPDNRLIYFRLLQVEADVWLMDAQTPADQ